jgi:hypothetical protein
LPNKKISERFNVLLVTHMKMFLKRSFPKAGALLALGLFSPVGAMAATGSHNLRGDDLVGVSFWVISMALVAATAFFFLETQRVSPKWKTSLTVSGLVTLVAATHYFYMREVWVATGEDSDGVPLHRLADHGSAADGGVLPHPLGRGEGSGGRFWRLMVGTLVMLVAGYAGEAGKVGVWPAFIVSMAGWFYIINEIYRGEAVRSTPPALPGRAERLPFDAWHRRFRLGGVPDRLCLRLPPRRRPEGQRGRLECRLQLRGLPQ